MTLREKRRTANVEQHKARRTACEGARNIGAVGFELQRLVEMGIRRGTVGCGNGGYGIACVGD
jgi:hypothetical protein